MNSLQITSRKSHQRPHVRSLLKALALTVLVLPSISVAATRYVEKWGANVAPCTKSAPCRTIQFAIDNASSNDRVTVGAGVYRQNLDIDVAGLKLESSAGRHATFIEPSPGSTSSVAVITQPNVKIGKKGKGFTFSGATAVFQSGIWINVDAATPRIKIEGNRFGLPRRGSDPANSAYANYSGLRILGGGDRIQIRHNIIENSSNIGIYCVDCPLALLQDNRITGNGSAGVLLTNSDQVSMRRNVISTNGSSGATLSVTVAGPKVKDNVAELNSSFGLFSGEVAGGRVESNIASRNGQNGVFVDQGAAVPAARVNGNLVVNNNNSGLTLRYAEDARVDNNTAVGNNGHGIQLVSIVESRSLKNNNAIDNFGCGLSANQGVHTYSGFFAEENFVAPICASGGATLTESGSTPTKPSALRVNRARALVGG